MLAKRVTLLFCTYLILLGACVAGEFGAAEDPLSPDGGDLEDPATALPPVPGGGGTSDGGNLQVPRYGGLKIMAIGDSITQADTGNNWRCFLGGYLRQHAEFANIDFVGSVSGPYAGSNSQCAYGAYDLEHEGYAGWTTDMVLSQVAYSAFSYTPDVALIHLGTNDLAGGQAPAGIVGEISTIVSYLRAANPSVVVFVAGIIPNAYTLPSVDGQTRQLNQLLAQFAATNSNGSSPIIFVDQYSGFSSATDSNDLLHPNFNGHVKVATAWYYAIYQYYLNPAPIQEPAPTQEPAPGTTEPSSAPPTGAIAFQRYVVSDTQFGLVWNEVAGATYYVLLASTASYNLPTQTPNTYWAIVDTNTSVAHYFSIFACNDAGCGPTPGVIGPISR